ncbi:glycosyltransferase family 32 protein [Bipolaris zeicola 26-R-13]|uniref:Glycosyltransferase family 32 protein n=1 Tax=Cochliobolus carbonum (strain 26-R-13) TaxID=930089 RepID=W6XJE3_COCC2|nr:glycosyltransferase family 32 protein [Bipolaris zeicola 26-R-13]EUC27257.1 glycosyltransferase family 32 protein [Bipolaris zeicola 26-R-13]
MIPRPAHLARILNYYTLIAICVIGLVYHLLSSECHFFAPVQHTTNGILKLIWYKLGPKGISNDVRNWTDTCIKSILDYQANFITDEGSDEYVRKAFAFRLDIAQAYLAFSIPIYKADMLRCLLLWDQGGIWYDLDVSCEQIPIDEWAPAEYKEAALVVVWEFDAEWPEPFDRQFASWTIMSRPRSPRMMQVIDDILEEDLTLKMMGDVVDLTGPRRLTTIIFRSLEKKLKTINPTEVHSILQPVLLKDVLILPGRSFAASANKYTPEQEALLPPQLVTHHYAGSWKNDKGGEMKRRRR